MTDEQRNARIRHHMYETCEGIREHAERIVALEELVSDLLSELEEEHGSAWKSISEYEHGNLEDLSRGFYAYAKLKGFAWGMNRAIFMLKYRAKKAGIEV